MAKKKGGDSELNLDSLMDAVTNVVGVLMIVFIMMALNTARMVQKILSDLPPVTPEQHQKMKEEVEKLPPPMDPKQIEEREKLAQQEMKKAVEQLKTIDTTSLEQRAKFMDLDELRKQLEARRKDREAAKAETDKLLQEVERLKALLDQTPKYVPPPPTYVRLPNPRPYPEKPNETRILVAKEGVLFFRESDYLTPIHQGLEKITSQLQYKDAKIDPFAKMLAKVLGSPAAAQQAWPEVAPLVNTFQLDQVALAYKSLAGARLSPSKELLSRLGDISLALNKPLPAVADAVAAMAGNNDFTKWLALDPSRDPTKPVLKATLQGNKIVFSYGSGKPVEVKASPQGVLEWIKTLSDLDTIKNRSRNKVIYDAFRLVDTLQRAASSQVIAKAYEMKPVIRPGSTLVQLQLKPRAGAGETVEQIKQPASGYQRLMREIKADPNGVAVFQVMPDAFTTYLDARRIADEIGVAATWEFLRSLDLAINLSGYEVQRFDLAPTTKPGTAPTVNIAAPKRSLD